MQSLTDRSKGKQMSMHDSGNTIGKQMDRERGARQIQ